MSRTSRSIHGGGAGFRALALGVFLVGAVPVGASEVLLDDSTGGCHCRGTFDAPISGAVAWDVLTDYDGIGRFVPSVRASRLELQPDGRKRLHQDAVGGFFLLRRRMKVLLELDEVPRHRIVFRDVLGKDFSSYVGEWRIDTDSTGLHVHYELRAEPRAAYLRGFCRPALRSAARDLLEQVREEMLRRHALVRSVGSDGTLDPGNR